jgi:hypothetical protein
MERARLVGPQGQGRHVITTLIILFVVGLAALVIVGIVNAIERLGEGDRDG